MSQMLSLPYHFYSSLVRPTAVELCVSGNFTSALDLNLIVVRNNSLEIYLIGPEGLSSIKEVNIYGKIKVLQLFRPRDQIKDFLFILTSRFNAIILEAEHQGDDGLVINTCSCGDLSNRKENCCEVGILSAIDPESKAIGLRLFDGLLTIIPIEKLMNEIKIINIWIEETEICDLNFLYGYDNPVVILLYKDSYGIHIKTYELDLGTKEIISTPWKFDCLESEPYMVIPVPETLGGALILGNENVSYSDGDYLNTANLPINISINCYTKVGTSGLRYILGNITGQLFMLQLENGKKINDSYSIKYIQIEQLGEITIPECITYLENGVIFVGSKIGDSQLIKLDENWNIETGTYITVLETFNNIGPIIDMIIVDLEKKGQDQLITCSGGFKEGSLRVIRKGVEIQLSAIIELSAVKGIWTLNINSFCTEDVLVLSFIGHSRVLVVREEEVEEVQINGFQSDCQTLFCYNIGQNIIVQIVPFFVRLMCLERNVLNEWKPPLGRHISIVAANKYQIICSSGSDIFYLEICNLEIIELKHVKLEFEVSCINMASFPDEIFSKYVAIGHWNDISVKMFTLPLLEEVHREYLAGDIIPRSLLFANFEGINYLFCALADGCLFYFIFNRFTGALLEKKRIVLGTQPLVLCSFKFNESNNVFVCSDRPAVIHSSERKLVFSNVNLKEVQHMCPFNTMTYPNSLVLANSTAISIGTIDKIQKLNIRTIRLNEGPRRIAHQECSQSLGIITTRLDVQGSMGLEIQRECASSRAQIISNSQQTRLPLLQPYIVEQSVDIGTEVEVTHFLLLDQNSFEILHAHQMLPNEYALSLTSCKLGNDPIPYYIVGTALVPPQENEPRLGRLIVFQVKDGKLAIIHEVEIKGGCYSLEEFNGKLLATINNAIQLYEWTSERQLVSVCCHLNNINALFTKTKGDFVLVGDLMRAVILLRYKTIEKTFEEIARDYNPHWMTAIEILDDETFLGAENSCNLFICQKNSCATDESERLVMAEDAQFHLGDMVNVFRRGSLIESPIGNEFESTWGSTLFGTISGAVGIVTHITDNLYFLLNELQEKLCMFKKSVGKIDHSFWRSFTSAVKTQPAVGFIDGDIIETFLDLSRNDMEIMIASLKSTFSKSKLKRSNDYNLRDELNQESPKKVNVDAVIKIVEDLKRLH